MTTQRASEHRRPYQLGIDVGSTTVKAVVLDGNRRLFSDYRRHNADVRASLGALLADVERALPGARVHAAITGSGGLTTARAMGIPFVQDDGLHGRRADVDAELVGAAVLAGALRCHGTSLNHPST